jgi:hypothetical protein
VKVQVTSKQFIDTDEIAFAEEDELNDNATRVWLKRHPNPITVYLDYGSFVNRLNTYNSHLNKTVKTS